MIAFDDCRRHHDSAATSPSRPLVLGIERVGRAIAAHRTNQTFRVARRAQRGPEVHQGLIEVEDVPVGKHGAGNVPQMPPHRMALGVAAADEHPEEHASDVGVENRGALAKGEAQDRACQYSPIPLNDNSVASSEGSCPP